jgi:G3E family GTPase
MQTESVPVTLLTGFLGAGKSTLLSRILKEEHGMRVAVIQNEKNNIGIEKITAVDEAQSETDVLEWIDLPNGCACCAVKDDLVQTLEMLIAKGRFEHILIELSGLADPSLLAQIFWTDEMLECPFYLDAVVCVADARHICDHLANTVGERKTKKRKGIGLLNKKKKKG